jgi:four helix bundle protein
MKETSTKSPLRSKSFDFAVRIVHLHRYLTSEKNEYVLSKQILRSGTSPGANIREAQNAESGNDFVHKLGIAQKEAAETAYWLELLHVTGFLSATEYTSIQSDCDELEKMLRSAILTKKKNMAAQTTLKIFLIGVVVSAAWQILQHSS